MISSVLRTGDARSSDSAPPDAAATRAASSRDSFLDVASALGYVSAVAGGDLDVFVIGALRNVGNTCYLNALVHVLARIDQLRRWFQQHLELWGVAHDGLRCPLCMLAQDINRLCNDVDTTQCAACTVKF